MPWWLVMSRLGKTGWGLVDADLGAVHYRGETAGERGVKQLHSTGCD
jgi:hypothetical protein